MRHWIKIGLAVTFVALLAGPMVRAQDGGEPAAGRVDDDWKYVNPGPAKSVEIGNFYLRRSNLKAALSRFQEAAHADPHYAPAQLGLGKVYDKMGQKRKALDAYQHYLDELPSARQAEQAKGVQAAVERLKKELGR